MLNCSGMAKKGREIKFATSLSFRLGEAEDVLTDEEKLDRRMMRWLLGGDLTPPDDDPQTRRNTENDAFIDKLNRRKEMKDSQKNHKNPCFLGKKKEVASVEIWPRDWEREKKKNPCIIRTKTVAVMGRMEEEKSNPEKEKEERTGKFEKDTVYVNPCILKTKTLGIVGKLEKNKD